MELKEAIERLKDDVKNAHLRDIVDDDCTICFTEDVDTVLQELDRLQRENTMLENTKNNCPHFNTSGISCDKKFCNLDDYISKDKIRELIEELNKLLPDIDYRDIKDKQEREYYKKEYHKVVAQINVLENLLKEE